MVSVKIMQGDVMARLKELPDNSVHCVVTSPPYWGLRDYGIEPVVWGGEPGCEHEWGEERIVKAEGLAGSGVGKIHIGKSYRPRDEGLILKYNASQGQFCLHCGAWRGSLGLEPTIELFVEHVVEIFREVRRVLRLDGVCFVNLGDSYNARRDGGHPGGKGGMCAQGTKEYYSQRSGANERSLKPKDLCGVPWRVALALQADGWYLRSDIIWNKPNPMPESVTDRPTRAHEYVFLLAKGQWKSRVIKFSDLPGERFHFVQNLGAGRESLSVPTWAAIDLATSIFNFAQSQNDFGLSPFYSEKWEKVLDGINTNTIGTIPVIHAAAAFCSRFLVADSTTKEFFQQIDSLGCFLSDANQLLIGTASPFKVPLPPSAFTDADGTITINYPGQICKISFLHKNIIIQNPVHCKYFWDQEAVREGECSENKAYFRPPSYLSGKSYDNSAKREKPESSKTIYQNIGRNLRSVWTIATAPFPSAHFATFPPKLVETCIKAGTSEHGVCPKCGAPWVRVVEKSRYEPPSAKEGERLVDISRGDKNRKLSGPDYNKQVKVIREVWRPSCQCADHQPVPATVCDIFGGAGTTGLVAAKMGRNAILIEIKPDYCDMAAKRIKGDLGMMCRVTNE